MIVLNPATHSINNGICHIDTLNNQKRDIDQNDDSQIRQLKSGLQIHSDFSTPNNLSIIFCVFARILPKTKLSCVEMYIPVQIKDMMIIVDILNVNSIMLRLLIL